MSTTQPEPTLLPETAKEPPPLAEGPATLRASFAIVDDFLVPNDAKVLRAHFDDHFSDPQNHGPGRHQVWNYWYIPRLYTYLKTQPEKVLPEALVQKFYADLTTWAKERLGLGYVSWPNLSLYVNGCVQELHNDSLNGRFGYVYSLSRNDRNSRGGQTIVLKEGDLFRSKLTKADAGSGLYDLIDPVFNRLTVFDDRMPHGVQRLEGSMDPYDGRIVLHGHISEDGPSVVGPLPREALMRAALPAISSAIKTHGEVSHIHHGPLVLRLAISADGHVRDHRVLVDRVARPDGGDPAALVSDLIAGIVATRFPETDKPNIATLPVLLGGVLPWMKAQKAAAQQ